MNKYEKFLESKKHSTIDYGIDLENTPSKMFDFQRHVAEFSAKRGRCAVFLDTGLGKTVIELTLADAYARHTNKPTLIITPLAVAFQFLKEAKKFSIADIEYSKSGKFKSKIVVCNYERLHYFDSNDFGCVILDESSILKNFDGKIKGQVTAFLKKVEYRYLFTATPSPNDYIELGTSSEALGYLGYMDMLGMFFKNNQGTIDIRHTGAKWYLKAHAERDFWEWVKTWSISMRKPSDLGYSDKNYRLPNLIENKHVVKNKEPLAIDGQTSLFNFPARNFREIKAEVKATLTKRCEKAAECSEGKEITVYWVNRNDESSLMTEIDKEAVEITGSMDLNRKEEILLAFASGQIKKLITKPKITAFGLNWQHCSHTVYFPTFSYEQYYQAIRRFWRFGQKRPVTVDLVLSDGQTRILESLMVKRDKAVEMFESLISAANGQAITPPKNIHQEISIPNFI